jgi:hypothetical protein
MFLACAAGLVRQFSNETRPSSETSTTAGGSNEARKGSSLRKQSSGTIPFPIDPCGGWRLEWSEFESAAEGWSKDVRG